MPRPKLEIVQTDSNAIRNAVSDAMKENQDTMKGIVSDAMKENQDSMRSVVEETARNVISQQKEEDLKQKHINKLLHKEVMTDKIKDKHLHDDSCPTCHKGEIKDLGNGVHICTEKDCGIAILDKKADFVICNDCDSPVPKSYVGTDKTCPRCGGKGVHKHK